MQNINKKTKLAIGALVLVCLIGLLYEGYFWTERSTIKGKVVQLRDAQGQRGDSWALENQPFSWWLTVTLQDLPADLKQDGITIECNVVSMDTSEGNKGIDAYAVVDNCKR